MIAEKDLLRAIEECEAEPITQSKIGKLADFYIIYDHLFGTPPDYGGYSYADKIEKVIENQGESEFLQAINGKNPERIWKIIDELMNTLKIINPRLYDGVLRRIE